MRRNSGFTAYELAVTLAISCRYGHCHHALVF